MQLYASHRIALNKSRLKILAHVSLNANYLLQAVCYCLHLIMCLCLKSSTLLFYSKLKTLFIHCANMPYMYHCPRYSYYQQKLVTVRSVQGVY